MKDRDILVLDTILTHINQIEVTMKDYKIDLEMLNDNFMVKNSLAMNLLQIGENVGSLSDELKAEYNKIEWRSIKDMRNIIAHGYGSIDLEILQDSVLYDIPQLEEYCQNILQDLLKEFKG